MLVCHLNLSRGFRGGERQTELLIRGLARRGWHQRLVTRSGEPLAKRLAGTADLSIVGTGGGPLESLRATGGAELLHAHDGRSVHIAVVRRLLGGVPVIATRREQNAPRPNPLTRYSYGRANCLVAISSHIARTLGEYLPGATIEFIPSASAGLAARPDEVEALRRAYPGKFLVGQVGALETGHKGQHVLLEVARRLARSHPDTHFLFLGEGSGAQQLQAMAEGLDNVSFEGFREDIGSYLAAFDLLAMPSLHEGLGSVLLDAMSFGLPAVASRVGGIPEVVIDGETGYLVEPGDARDLEAKILALHGDRERLGAMGLAARQRAQLYSAERMVSSYEALYRRVIG